MIKLHKGDAERIFNSRWWIGRSDEEIVFSQLFVKDFIPICDNEIFLNAFRNVFDREFKGIDMEPVESLLYWIQHEYRYYFRRAM